MKRIKKSVRILSFSLLLFFLLGNLNAQTEQRLHAPVSAGSSTADRSGQTDSERYKAMQERDRENIRRAIQQGKENQEAINGSKNELRQRKLIAKVATSVAFALIGLVVYFRNKKKADAAKNNTGAA